jgi:transcription initiation factor TFIID subunit 8
MNPAFLHEIQRLVVAQVCDCFDTVKSSAADALAEVLASYIKEIGRAAHECADVAGRTDVNIGDVLSALDAVGAKFQTIVRDAESFEVPFAHALPARLQIKRLPKRAPAFREIGERAEAHFPKVLPALPDAHALRRSAGELAEPLSEKERLERSRTLEEPLEDVLGSLRKTHALTKKRRFGEFANRGVPGDVAAAQFRAWETASARVGAAAAESADLPRGGDFSLSREDVALGLDATARDVEARDGALETKPAGASFREQSNLSNADYETVERLVRGQTSVFEAS